MPWLWLLVAAASLDVLTTFTQFRDDEPLTPHRTPINRVVRAGMAELDEALGRPRRPASWPSQPVRSATQPKTIDAVAPQRRRTPGAWVDALKVRGVPAHLQNGRVVVEGIGPVPVPPKQDLKKAARRFVGEQTKACGEWLTERVMLSLETQDPRVTVRRETAGWLSVCVDGARIARVTRFSVIGDGFGPSLGDLRRDESALAVLAPAVARALRRGDVTRVSKHLGEPTSVMLEAVRDALSSRVDVSSGELSQVLGLDRELVIRAMAELEQQGWAERLRLPSGEPGYRKVDTPQSRQRAANEPSAGIPGPSSADADESALGTLDELARFLSACGTQVTVTSEGRLRIRTVLVKPPAAALNHGEGRTRWLDAFVAEHLSEELIENATFHLPRHRFGFRLELVDGDVVVFDRRSRRIARIKATRATVGDAPALEGNYLTAGSHWDAVRDALVAIADNGEPFADAGVHREFPMDIDPAWREAAEEASRRLRRDRTLAFAHEIRVDVEGVTLTFAPLTAPPAALEIPFRLDRGPDRFTGAVRLTSDIPLPCAWHQGSDLATLALAWTLALTAYAELTCRPPQRANRRDPISARRPSSRSSSSRGRSTGIPSPGGVDSGRVSNLPSGFSARGNTVRYLASYVAGHRRRLQPGQHHGDEAARNAAAVGITLRGGETWVQPHVRGVPADAVLHFAWSGPSWAKAALRRRS